MDRYRLVLALILSVLVLVSWQFVMRRVFPPPPEPPPEQQVAVQPEPGKEPAPPAATAARSTAVTLPAAPPQADIPRRELIIETAYWKVKLSNHGAVATSWILTHDKSAHTVREIHAATGGELELIPQDVLEKLGAPLALRLPAAPDLAGQLNRANFRIEGVAPDESAIKLEPGQEREITFVYASPAAVVRKKFKFYGDGFVFDATAEVTANGTSQPAEFVIGPRIGDQTDKQAGSYSTPPQVIALSVAGEREQVLAAKITETAAKVTYVEEAASRVNLDKPLTTGGDQVKLVAGDGTTFLGYARVVSREPLSLTLDELPRGVAVGCSVAPAVDVHRSGYRWAGVVDHYFAMVAVPSRPVGEIALANAQFKSNDTVDDYPSASVPVDPGSVVRIYVGTKDRKLLAEVGEKVGADLGPLIDYGFFAFLIRPLVPAIGWALDGLAGLFHNYGWSIVVVTIIINIALSPLRLFSSKKMKKAAKHQPRMKELQEKMKKLKENPKKFERELQQLQKEQVALMKEANPLGGCLPMLLQMPVFWTFFVYLTISLDVRQSPWIFWIKDLSVKDPLHVLPIVMCVTMIASTWLTPQPAQADPAMKMQRIMMTWLMPIMLTWFFFLSAPSGLVLYWMVSNVVGVAIQLVINKATAEPTAVAAATAGTAGAGGKSREPKGRARKPRERRDAEA
ncbi:MAG TPA: YidC/Oxa1 family insertase periplasmic-domain containing protein [Blastocatellia bacterium]|nr:YidC/Oxa1 family insertase periplasmic-domain containing protein [Blastocatellia bacterium]